MSVQWVKRDFEALTRQIKRFNEKLLPILL